MKKKYILVFLAVVVLGALSWLYFKNNNGIGQEEIVSGLSETDEFSIIMPEGWQKSETLPAGVKFMALDPSEKGLSQTAKDLGFRTYFTVTTDVATDLPKDEYMQLVKDEILKLDANASFFNEKQLEVNGLETKSMEIEMSQQGIDFKVLMTFMWSDEGIWGIGFNTTQEQWLGYQQLLTDLVNSFKLK
jgi:hypothetical protein